MKGRRAIVFFLIVLLALPGSPAGSLGSVQAANESNMRYYYGQLTGEAQKFYDAMYQMYVQGIFKTGTQDYDLIAGGHLTQEQLAAYEGGSSALLSSMGAARDAFYADYPDIFYVDFSNLSLRVTRDGAGNYHAYLGSGRTDNYFVQGFTSKDQVEAAIREHEAKVAAIVEEARKLSAPEGKSLVEEQIRYVHNSIIQNTSYHLETDCSPGNAGHIATSYGALVKGESLCEGYARAVKTVLDSLGITSVLVQGYYQITETQGELHMWNSVKIDDKWYGVDATADDRVDVQDSTDTYLIADAAVMGKHHRPSGIMSPANFEFTYPELYDIVLSRPVGPSENPGGNIDYKELFNKDGFLVEYKEEEIDGTETGIFRISYNGKGYHKAVEEDHKYMLVRFYQYLPGKDDYEVGNWVYMDPAPFAMPQLDDAVVLPSASSRIIEFALTELPPAGPLYGDNLTVEEINRNWTFQGDESQFLVSTGKLENPKGNFVPSPFARTLTPSNTASLVAGKKYSVKAQFNEKLKQIEGEEVSYTLTSSGWSGVEKSKVENFSWDGDRTFTFDFTPSNMFADNNSLYTFQVTGVIGEGSLKAPDAFQYDARIKSAICAYRSRGYYWNVFGKPTLLENSDLSASGWTDKEGNSIPEGLRNRIAIVASRPDEEQIGQMNGMIGGQVLKSETYDIKLSICKMQVAHTGDSIRISLGFPEGYGPDDEGVTFKAYHFMRNDAGEITGVEEIGCAVTQYGLIITCKSFSPFAVVAVKDDNPSGRTGRTVVLSSSAGGSISGDSIFTLEEGQSRTVTVSAKDGYRLEKVNLAGVDQKLTDNKSMTLEIKYSDLKEKTSIVDASFVSETVYQKESARGESPVIPMVRLMKEPDVPSDNEPSDDESSDNDSSDDGSSDNDSSGDESSDDEDSGDSSPDHENSGESSSGGSSSEQANNNVVSATPAPTSVPAATPAPAASGTPKPVQAQAVTGTGSGSASVKTDDGKETGSGTQKEDETAQEPWIEESYTDLADGSGLIVKQPEDAVENPAQELERMEVLEISYEEERDGLPLGIILVVIFGVGIASVAGTVIWKRYR